MVLRSLLLIIGVSEFPGNVYLPLFVLASLGTMAISEVQLNLIRSSLTALMWLLVDKLHVWYPQCRELKILLLRVGFSYHLLIACIFGVLTNCSAASSTRDCYDICFSNLSAYLNFCLCKYLAFFPCVSGIGQRWVATFWIIQFHLLSYLYIWKSLNLKQHLTWVKLRCQLAVSRVQLHCFSLPPSLVWSG